MKKHKLKYIISAIIVVLLLWSMFHGCSLNNFKEGLSNTNWCGTGWSNALVVRGALAV